LRPNLRTLAQHQKVLLELDQMLRRIGTERSWSRTRLAIALIELEQRINSSARANPLQRGQLARRKHDETATHKRRNRISARIRP
jgi:hypothetical protein